MEGYKKMKVKIDRNKCIGCGACAAVCPEVFEMKGEKASVKKATTDKKCAKEAEKCCPVQAIKVS